MTENEIREMYKSLANGDKWECKCNRYNTCSQCEIGVCPDETWRAYKLGEAIHENFEYRKVEKYIVFFNTNVNLEIGLKSKHSNLKLFEFEGTKEECEQWIKEHTKTWLDEYYPLDEDFPYDDFDINKVKRSTIEEVCQKILEEMDKTSKERQIRNESFPLNFQKRDIEQIILHLGVNIDLR